MKKKKARNMYSASNRGTLLPIRHNLKREINNHDVMEVSRRINLEGYYAEG